MMVVGLLLAGGIGNRMGSTIPKQYMLINNRPMISYSIETLGKSTDVDAIWIVAEEKWQEHIVQILTEYKLLEKCIGFSIPGINRQHSILNGLWDMKKWFSQNYFGAEENLVLIHDAARPYLTCEDIHDYVLALEGHDGVLPVLPMKDTVYLSEDSKTVSSLLSREKIFAGQAPELFKFEKYLEANLRLINPKVCDFKESIEDISYDGIIIEDSPILSINGSTEVAIMAGMDIVLVSGNEKNIKITTPSDMGI